MRRGPAVFWILSCLLPWTLAACELAWPSSPTRPTSPTSPSSTTVPAPVALFVEPDAGRQAVLELIASARASLWMEMYLLTDAGAIAAVTERAAAGCDVRVILEPAPYQQDGANQAAYDQLVAAGVDVRWSLPRFTYTHAKAFTIDHRRLAILTLNLSGAGLAGNREYAALDDDATDVAAAEAIFTADATGAATGTPPADAGRLISSPESSRPALLALLGGAHASLALETEELTDAAVISALLDARARGVAVTLAWPGPAAGAGAPFTTLAAAGAIVRAVGAPAIHGKVVVADDRTLYLGSVNLTPTSLDDNRELGLLLAEPPLAAEVAEIVAVDVAGGVGPAP